MRLSRRDPDPLVLIKTRGGMGTFGAPPMKRVRKSTAMALVVRFIIELKKMHPPMTLSEASSIIWKRYGFPVREGALRTQILARTGRAWSGIPTRRAISRLALSY